MTKKKGIDAEIDKCLRIMAANPDGPADIAANLLNQARISGDGPLRQKYLRLAQEQMAQIDPHEEPEVLQDLQAQVLALQGRGGDTQIAHVTPGEVVIPKRMRTPELMAALARAARAAGVDPRRLVVGSRRNSVNPRTGQVEFREIASGIDDMVVHEDDQNPFSETFFPNRYQRSIESSPPDASNPASQPPQEIESVTVTGRQPFTLADILPLARLVHGEAGNQTPEVKRQVIQAALSRVGSGGNFPDALRGVMNQPGQFQALDVSRNGPYFAPIKDGMAPGDEKSWHETFDLAHQAITDAIDNGVDYGPRFFHDVEVPGIRAHRMEFDEPTWASRAKQPFPRKN